MQKVVILDHQSWIPFAELNYFILLTFYYLGVHEKEIRTSFILCKDTVLNRFLFLPYFPLNVFFYR